MTANSVEFTDVAIPEAFAPLWDNTRYKVFYGGRGGAKSWAFARALILKSLESKTRILCAREMQVSIADSVHRLLTDQIFTLGLSGYFTITKIGINNVIGSEFIFKGLRHNVQEIKSLEGVDICWVEEAQAVSRESWNLLIPTIRADNSEIWISFNPNQPDDETYSRFVLKRPDNAVIVKVGWQDNPFFPKTLAAEKDFCKRTDPDAYAHIWEGEPCIISDAQVFKNKYVIEAFETPSDVRFFHGVDWGFAQDPSVIIRCFINGENLYIDSEAYGVGVELTELAGLFNNIQTARDWGIKADNSRPETISFMSQQGFDIKAAKKWQGSVEDGIAYMKGFNKVYIHPSCKRTADEFRLYSYKVDKNNGDILPVLIDKHNHCIDAVRYALDGYITSRGSVNYDKAYSAWFGEGV